MKSHKILLIDDEPHILKSLVSRLQKEGFETVSAETGGAALALLEEARGQSAPFDLVLLDIILPGLSGIEVLREIRLQEEHASIPRGEGVRVVMLTALKDSWCDNALNEGCDDYLVKPFKPEVLMRCIRKNLRGR